MKNLDFRKVKKTYLNVTLADEKNTTLMIGTPTKRTIDTMLSLGATLRDTQEALTDTESMSDNVSSDLMDELYKMVAKIMSHNKAGVKITADQIADMFDFEDIFIFFRAYMEFVDEIGKQKN